MPAGDGLGPGGHSLTRGMKPAARRLYRTARCDNNGIRTFTSSVAGGLAAAGGGRGFFSHSAGDLSRHVGANPHDPGGL